MKKALTMIELIVVIVILGILSAGSMNIFMQVYDNYNITKRVTYLESKTSSIIDTLNAKLRKRFAESIRYRCANNNNEMKYLRDVKVGDRICSSGNPPTVLEWVVNYDKKYLYTKGGTDVYSRFCFSGVVDMTKTLSQYVKDGTASNIHNTIRVYDIENITTSGECFSNGEEVGVYFLDTIYNKNFIEDVLLTGNISNGNSITIEANKNTKNPNIAVSSAYQLAKTAQAISMEEPKVHEPNKGSDVNKTVLYNMYLYYDYQPWKEEFQNNKISDYQVNTNIKKVLIAENVSQFKTIQYGDAVGIDICIDDPNYKVQDEKGQYKFLRVCKIGGAI